ncbi:DUF6187 family protein [Actinophytocola sp.]|uniref:DUF6187 family protein n=1 Tax=Actinophytocola sp. TaxID=1872138 RepID=UPI002ED8F7A9
MPEPYDTVFSLPAVDDPAETEIGVLLMGFGPERLLAGLGVASGGLAEAPAGVTVYIDQLRHGARDDVTFDDALAAGAGRWRAAGRGLAEIRVGPGALSAALRQQWAAAARGLATAAERVPALRTSGDAERVYLIACWLRREEITRTAEELCPT